MNGTVYPAALLVEGSRVIHFLSCLPQQGD